MPQDALALQTGQGNKLFSIFLGNEPQQAPGDYVKASRKTGEAMTKRSAHFWGLLSHFLLVHPETLVGPPSSYDQNNSVCLPAYTVHRHWRVYYLKATGQKVFLRMRFLKKTSLSQWCAELTFLPDSHRCFGYLLQSTSWIQPICPWKNARCCTEFFTLVLSFTSRRGPTREDKACFLGWETS